MLVDFAVIGAQKSGTTAFFEYFNKHPNIALPLNKEAPYFVDQYSKVCFSEYFSYHYERQRKIKKLIGSVSPQYMCYDGCSVRMAKHNPSMKIIAILREPISRIVSHYRMNLRRGIEERDINTVLKVAISGDFALPVYSKDERENEKDNILIWSLYGTALRSFFENFPRNNILILDQKELDIHAFKLYNKVCEFLNIDNTFIPKNLGKCYHVGGDSTFFPRSEELSNFLFLKKMWHLLPKKIRGKISYWYEIHNVKTNNIDTNYHIDESIATQIVALIKKDCMGIPELQQLVNNWYGND